MTSMHSNPPGSEEQAVWRRYERRSQAEPSPCPAPEELIAYLDGMAADDCCDRIEHHLADCPRCLSAIVQMRQLAEHPPEAISLSSDEAVEAVKALMIKSQAGTSPSHPPLDRRVLSLLGSRPHQRWAAAAAFMITATGGLLAGLSCDANLPAQSIEIARATSAGDSSPIPDVNTDHLLWYAWLGVDQ